MIAKTEGETLGDDSMYATRQTRSPYARTRSQSSAFGALACIYCLLTMECMRKAVTNQTKARAASSFHKVVGKQRDERQKGVELSPEDIQRRFAHCLACACQSRHGATSIG